ncbi:low specificity L-threonine aldolase [Marinilabiliaceae bacterium JC017]|nr:low specificity L-threonine aldolase [Marinilabiliaceae bacterium JC017]
MYHKGFASDNNAGVHPAVMQALSGVNKGHAVGYGEDTITASAIELFKEVLGDSVEVFFVYNGTGANVLALQALTQSYNAVICSDVAHIHVDECGAPEKLSGCKLLTVHSPNGKLTVDLIKQHMHGFGFEHHAQPKVISITQATELGTVYSIEEIKTIAEFAHENGLYLHMDGARLANAAASLQCSLKELTFDAGVDVLSFGGTKNGLMFGEAVVFANRQLAENVKYVRKQSAQLHSKMRFIAAQFKALLSNGLWLDNARQANQMAILLADRLKAIPQVEVTQKVDSNGIFAIVPEWLIEPLQKSFFFYVWDESRDEVRWMTSFDTVPEDIDAFIERIKEIIAQNK